MLWGELHFLIRTLQGRDLFRLLRLRRRGVYLDLERYLVSGYPFFRTAVRSWVTREARTYVGYDRDRHLWYILQAARREDRPEWDVSFLAPARAVRPRDGEQWARLLQRLVRDAVHQGVYRLYAALPTGFGLEHVFRQAGFRPYTREQVLRLAQELAGECPALDGEVRLYTDHDAWEFRRLWQRVTPQVVAAAEGLVAQNGLATPYAWTLQPDNRIYLWWRDDELVGAVGVRFGPRGRWLRFLLQPDLGDERVAFICWAIRRALTWGVGPTYCAVPDYVGGVRAVLADIGFVPFAERVLTVRHLAVALHAEAGVPQAAMTWAEVGGEPVYWLPETAPHGSVGAHQAVGQPLRKNRGLP